MNIGIIGLPFVGKTTLFKLLSGISGEIPQAAETRVVKVSDQRVDRLSENYHPKKTTHATIQFTDTPGLDPKAGSKERNRIFGVLQSVDALLWVIGNFEGVEKTPEQQVEDIKSEILIHDLEILENGIERLTNAKRKLEKPEEEMFDFLKKLHVPLDQSLIPPPEFLEEAEKHKNVGGLNLFSLKPSILLLNSDEKRFSKATPGILKVQDFCVQNHLGYLELSGKFEMEMNEFSEEERAEFLSSLGLQETGIQRLTRVVYEKVGLISFFTVGEDEVKAWTIRKNTCAKEAAGKIHTDLERGFIRAEVMKYDDLIREGQEKKLKELGLFKVVGKEYIVEDGDILHIRFNI
jgi:GTP-binding protein YchF